VAALVALVIGGTLEAPEEYLDFKLVVMKISE
jgi:hypothetical protein